MAKEHWVQKAISRPGQLHRDLGVPQGEKIPKSKLDAAAKRGGKVGDRARLAETMEGFNHHTSHSSSSTTARSSGAHPAEKPYLHMIPSRSGK